MRGSEINAQRNPCAVEAAKRLATAGWVNEEGHYLFGKSEFAISAANYKTIDELKAFPMLLE